MYQPKYCMFFDNHTMKACPDVGHAFDANDFAVNLESCGVDLVGFPAKCNQGFCYYETTKGTRHPSLRAGHDMFGDIVAACGKLGIAVNAYLNCGLSNETAIEHPEWCMISPDGRILRPDIYDLGETTPYMRTLCFNSPYRGYILGLIREVAEKYPVKGFLLDSFNGFPCVCPHCVRGMNELGLDFRKDTEKFAEITKVRLAEDIAKMLLDINPEFLFFFLGLSVRDNARIGTYMECECLPTNPSWGYDYLPLMARYMRNVSDRTIINMTGRFYDWGDFGSLRPQAAIEYDLLFGLANGMRPNIGDHIHPRGDLNHAAFERISNIYNNIRQYEPWFEGARNLTEIAMVLTAQPSLNGAIRMLSELKMQFDVVDADCDWSKYSVMILPDDIVIDEKTAAKLAGKKVLATGFSGLNPDKTEFVLEHEWGVKYLGECEYDPAYFQMNGVTGMPTAVYSRGAKVAPLDDIKVLGNVIAPYYNRHWDGEYSHYYAPPDRMTELPFATLHNNTAYCSFPLFSAYYKQASVELRNVLATLLAELLPQPLLKVELPSFARAFVTAQTDRTMLHLLNYVPELRGKTLMVEEPIDACNVKVSLRTGHAPSKVRLTPHGPDLEFTMDGDYLHFILPEMCGYALIEVN